MTCRNFWEHLMTNFKYKTLEKVFTFFEELCKIPHGSGNMEKIADYCVEFAKKRGLRFVRDDANNVITEAELRYFIANGGTVKLGADIDLATGIVVNKQVTLDLNGKTITAKNDPNGDGIFYVRAGGDLTINGEGTIDSACQTNNYSMAIWAKETGKVVTIEEHSVIGGLGSAVCDCLAEKAPTKVLKIGVNDTFGESGPAVELIKKYGLDAESIYNKVKAFMA